MAGALDEDTRRSLNEGRATLMAMLRSAQRDLQKVFLVFVAGFIGTFYLLRAVVWAFLKDVTSSQMSESTRAAHTIIAQTPFDVILLQAKISLSVGVIVALPVVLFYGRGALRRRGLWPSSPIAVWKLASLSAVAGTLFVLGLLYGYLVFFPFMFAFLAENAAAVGFLPHYSIVLWTEFMFLLTVSFALAAQMPLLITGCAYTGIISYETFRDKWRHAVVLIVAMGAMFTPPDPFTQLMWAGPMLLLYGGSLYAAKVIVTAKRGSESVRLDELARGRWNTLLGGAVAGFAGVYAFYTRGGVGYVNGLLAAADSRYRLMPAGGTLGVAPPVEAGAFALGGALLGLAAVFGYHLYVALDDAVDPLAAAGAPADIDVGDLDLDGVRAAPPEAFAAMEEEEAVALAGRAMETDEPDRAQAILDRYDAAATLDSGDDGGLGDRASRAADTFSEELAGDDTGLIALDRFVSDVSALVSTLASRSFRIVASFAAVMGVVFAWLYTGGIGTVFDSFVGRLSPTTRRTLREQVTSGADLGEAAARELMPVVALHPMEALLFEVKFSMVVAGVAVLPLVGYYAWPTLRERGLVRRHRANILAWTATLLAGLAGGVAFGYLYAAPTTISFLVGDAVRAEMVIAYRISSLLWLVFFLTVGIGLLADVPLFMLLLNANGVPYRSFRGRWREVTVGIMTVAAVFTPASVSTLVLVTVPLMCAYAVGLALLFVVTLGGRRNLAPAMVRLESEA